MPVVLTSATSAARARRPGGRAFAESTTELDVGSPFAYKAHGLLYCAASLPDRRRPEAEAAIHDEIEALVLAAGGRTLALFTSRRAMTVAAEVLAAGSRGRCSCRESFRRRCCSRRSALSRPRACSRR